MTSRLMIWILYFCKKPGGSWKYVAFGDIGRDRSGEAIDAGNLGRPSGFRGLDRDFLTIFPREDHFDRVDRHLRIILRRNIISPGEIPVFCLYVLQGKDWGTEKLLVIFWTLSTR